MPTRKFPFGRKANTKGDSPQSETSARVTEGGTQDVLRLSFEWDAKGMLTASLTGSDVSDSRHYGPFAVPYDADAHDYCLRTANDIEESLGKPLQWSMPQGKRPMPRDLTLPEFCSKHGIPDEYQERAAAAIRNNPKGSVKTNTKGALVIPGVWEEHYVSVCSDIIQEAEEERRFIQAEEARVAAVVRSMPITSTNGFEGYRIVEYGGYVSGDEAIMLADSYFSAGDFFKDEVNDKIKQIRSTAIEELKVAAAQIGCNAIVGLDFDYVTIDRQRQGFGDVIINNTFIILTANGTAVTIESLS